MGRLAARPTTCLSRWPPTPPSSRRWSGTSGAPRHALSSAPSAASPRVRQTSSHLATCASSIWPRPSRHRRLGRPLGPRAQSRHRHALHLGRARGPRQSSSAAETRTRVLASTVTLQAFALSLCASAKGWARECYSLLDAGKALRLALYICLCVPRVYCVGTVEYG